MTAHTAVSAHPVLACAGGEVGLAKVWGDFLQELLRFVLVLQVTTFSLLLQCPSMCHSLLLDLYLSPSSSWGHWWQLAAADVCGPSRSPSRAEPLEAPV